ncbi:MAG TPA: ABC transporter permease [Phycisphaerales bacterium]|nr:ABC transporter permease [Phycisphaerales bacterium]
MNSPLRAQFAIASKDIRLLLRDRVSFFFAFFFPLIIAVFFGVIFSSGGSGTMDVLLHDADQTDGSRSFAETLRGASEFQVTDVASPEEGVDLVRAGKATALIVLPSGFGKSRDGMFWSGGTRIELAVDPAAKAQAAMLEGVLTKYGFLQLQEGFKDPSKMQEQVRKSLASMRSDQNLSPANKLVFDSFFNSLDRFLGQVDGMKADAPKSDASARSDKPADATSADSALHDAAATAGGGWQPIRIDRLSITRPGAEGPKPPNSFSITFPQGIIWGVMGCALGFSISLVTERTKGTMVRLLVAPISPRQVLMGKALACFLSTLGVSVFLLAIGYGMGVRPTSWPLLILAVLAVGVCFVGIMMLLAALSPSERSAGGLGWGVLLVCSMIGGGMIPLFFMPDWMRSISIVSPIRWSVQALEGGIWRGSSLAEMVAPIGVLVGIGVVGFVAGAAILGRSRTPT